MHLAKRPFWRKSVIIAKGKCLAFAIAVFCAPSCNQNEQGGDTAHGNVFGEYIWRHHDEYHLVPQENRAAPPPHYPWQHGALGPLHPITKEYFRCKGSILNPPKITCKDGRELFRLYDCGGHQHHSLPLREGKEFIYPILLELLNRLQITLNRPVIITSGHRCPLHNAYIDSGPKNSASKHTIGAEVDFYVHGLEQKPELVIKEIMQFYATEPRYEGKKEYVEFRRYEKPTDTSTVPWYNKEVFLKVWYPHEGRNEDNPHPHPYLTIQVRFDHERSSRVVYSPQEAQAYLRK